MAWRPPVLGLKATLDLSKTGDITREWLVSRRHNSNLFDVMATLRKSVLASPLPEEEPHIEIMDEGIDGTW